MQKFERPNYSVEVKEEANNYAKFVISPLERGFGTTIGNALRRIMLSSLPGGAIYLIKIEGEVFHEFTSISGVREDVALIILKLKELILKISDDNSHSLKLNVKGPATVTGADIVTDGFVEVLNPELEIAHLDQGGVLNMEMLCINGRGYISGDENEKLFKTDTLGIGTIYIDSIYTPVNKVNYSVTPTRAGQSQNCDCLTMEVWTNGAISPKESIALSSKILSDHLSILMIDPDLDDSESLMMDKVHEKDSKIINMSIEDLDLTVRSYNCLKRAGIATVEELVSRSEDEMAHVRNLGKKSLKEVKEKLDAMGLTFRKDTN